MKLIPIHSPTPYVDPFDLPATEPDTRPPDPAEDDGEEIDALRERIDALDADVRALLHARAALAVRIGQLKRARGEPTVSLAREHDVLAHARADDDGAMPALVLEDVFRVVVHACRHLQARPAVACLGPAGSFSHVAARQRFGTTARVVTLPTITAVVEAAARGEVDHALVPVQARGGRIDETHAAVARLAARVRVTSEFRVPIVHRLIGRGPIDRIAEVRSRPEVLRACASWLDQHLPRARRVATESTSQAVHDAAASGDATIAAIGSGLAGRLYELPELARLGDPRDDPQTTFWLVRTIQPEVDA